MRRKDGCYHANHPPRTDFHLPGGGGRKSENEFQPQQANFTGMGVTSRDTRTKRKHGDKMSSTPIRLSKSKISKRKAQLKRLHKIYSWRKMARDIFNNEIKFGTLERFVTDPDYVPKEIELLRVLDLLPPPRSPYHVMPRWWNRTPEALERFMHTKAKAKEMYDNTKREQFSYRKTK